MKWNEMKEWMNGWMDEGMNQQRIPWVFRSHTEGPNSWGQFRPTKSDRVMRPPGRTEDKHGQEEEEEEKEKDGKEKAKVNDPLTGPPGRTGPTHRQEEGEEKEEKEKEGQEAEEAKEMKMKKKKKATIPWCDLYEEIIRKKKR